MPQTRHALLSEALHSLDADLERVRADPSVEPRTARLLAASTSKKAKKLAEEAVEVALDAVRGDQAAVISETADLLYNLAVLLDGMGVEPADVEAELQRRRSLYGVACKLPKAADANV